MSAHEDAKTRAATTYDAASDRYDDPANAFWARFGRRTVERLRLERGASVLDVCCGSGESALAAAEQVGPAGAVLGIDVAERLLALARRKAVDRGLGNVTFRTGDMLDLGRPAPGFDAVVCVFGIFFVEDMAAAIRELWRVVRPGGQLAITTWGPRFFEPGSTAFWAAIRQVRPDLHRAFSPWDRICEPEALHALLAEAGIAAADIVAEPGRHPIPSPDAWWTAVLGSGYRGTLEQLRPADRERVQAANLAYVRTNAVDAVEVNVLYAIARRGL